MPDNQPGAAPPQPSAISGAFRRPFPEQVAYFRGKLGNLVPTRRWDDLSLEQHDTAFMVAGAIKADLLADLAKAVDGAIAEGKSLDAFRKDFDAAVARHDWHGWTGEDSKGGRAWRTRTIYRTNARVSYAAGRLAQLKAGNFPFWVYRHGGSLEPRIEHLSWNGLVLASDDSAWSWLYPPSDWGCSCYVVGARSAAAARRLGGDPDKRKPVGFGKIDPRTGAPIGVGKGWNYAPGASVVASILAKVAGMEPPIRAAFLAEMAEQLSFALPLPRIAEPPLTSVKQLDDAAREAIVGYTATDYRQINAALRFTGRLTPQAKLIAAALDRARLPEPVRLYRAILGDYADDLRSVDLGPGFMFEEPAFMSTSAAREIANKWRNGHDNGIIMIVNAPAGTRGLDVVAISEHAREREVLLQHGSKLRVIKWDDATGELEVVIDD